MCRSSITQSAGSAKRLRESTERSSSPYPPDGLHDAATGEGVRLEEVSEALDAAGDAAAVGRHRVEPGPTAHVAAALESAHAVGESRPDVGLEEGVAVVAEVEAGRLVGVRVAREHVGSFGMKVEPRRVDDHTQCREIDVRWPVARLHVDERDLSPDRLGLVAHADLRGEDRRPGAEAVHDRATREPQLRPARRDGHAMGGQDLAQEASLVHGIAAFDLDHVDGIDAPYAPGDPHGQARLDAGDVVAVAKPDAQALRLLAIPGADRIGIHQAVAQ
jgi:hypothetical protein